MKKKRIILLLCFILLIPGQLFATTTPKKLGTLTSSPSKIIYRGVALNTYKCYDNLYVSIADLRRLGCNITYVADSNFTTITKPLKGNSITTASALNLTGTPFTIHTGTVHVGRLKTQAITCNDSALIPIGALREIASIAFKDNNYYLTFINEVPVTVTQTQVSNHSNEALEITVADFYWKSKKITKINTYFVPAGGSVSRNAKPSTSDTRYLASVVQSANGKTIKYSSSSEFGQVNTGLLQKIDSQNVTTYKSKYGDPIDSKSIEWAEKTVNKKGLSSPTKYLVWTNIDKQRTYIFTGSKGKWKLYKQFICSSGRYNAPTPKGTYALTYKVPSFGQSKGYCCKYAFGFIGTEYLYHSIIFDKTGTYLLEGKGVLGKRASDGCIRFSVEHAKWFYDNMISKTTVWIN